MNVTDERQRQRTSMPLSLYDSLSCQKEVKLANRKRNFSPKRNSINDAFIFSSEQCENKDYDPDISVKWCPIVLLWVPAY